MSNEDGAAMSFLVGRHGHRLLNRQYWGLLKVFGTALVKALHLEERGCGGVLIVIQFQLWKDTPSGQHPC